MKTMTTIHSAEAQYRSQYGKFAGSLQELRVTEVTDGYRLTLSLTPQGYAIHAEPTQYGTTGTRTFFSDQSLQIHQHYGPKPASASDPLVK